MAQHHFARSGTWVIAAAAAVTLAVGPLSPTARSGDEPAYSVAVESSDRDRTVLLITVPRDVDVRDFHLLPHENPPLNPPRQLPDIAQKILVLGGAVFERAPSPQDGMLCFLKKPGEPKTEKGTWRVVLDWLWPTDPDIDYIGIAVALTTNRDATQWSSKDLIGGRQFRIGRTARIPALVPKLPAPVETSIEAPYFTLSAPAELKADAAAMRSALDRGIAALKKQFAPLDVGGLLSKVTVTIQLCAERTDKAGVGLATMETGTTDGTVETYYGRMYMLAPSAHPADARTAAGEPMDLAYCKRVLLHEYSTVLLDLVCRAKGKGWQFFKAPAWFVQGYEEYLGLTCADAQAGKVTLGKYISMVKAHPEWVSFDFGLDVAQPYVAGPVLIHFLHARYGGARVRAVLTSRERTFGRAIRTSLGIGVDQVGADWMAWIKQEVPSR